MPFKLIAVVVWLVATCSLAGWWLVFGLQQIERLSEMQSESTQLFLRQHRMLVQEAAVLFVLLLAGGVSLIYFIWVEMRRARQIREFFAAFTHDLKTSLASLRLQAESLEEDLKDSEHARITRRLVKDTVRLELQLENSLFVASPDAGALYLEDLDLRGTLSSMRHQWPELTIEVERGAVLRADSRALESILKNLIQNAVVHGKASKVVFSAAPGGDGRVRLTVVDDGAGFKGDPNRLGQLFVRHSNTSGSGIGLHIASTLAARMQGRLEFRPGTGGFRVELELPGRLA